MKLNSKHYKFKKVEKYLKTSMFLIVNVGCTKQFKRKVYKYDIKSYHINNNFATLVFQSSIFKNYKFLFISSVVFLDVNKCSNIEVLKHFNIIGIKVNKKIYSTKQFNTVRYLNYNKTVKTFVKVLNRLILKSYSKLLRS